jgi:hypothetical protein
MPSKVLSVPGGAIINQTRGAVDLSALTLALARIDGLVNVIDPAVAPNASVNGTVVSSMRDRVGGKAIRSNGHAPIVAAEAGVANGRILFDTIAQSECDLSQQDVSFDGSMTFFTLVRPGVDAASGAEACYLFALTKAGASLLDFLFNPGTPELLLRDPVQGVGVAHVFGDEIQAAIPVVIGCRIDADAKTFDIFVNDGAAPASTAAVASVGDYSGGRLTMMGSKNSTGSLRSRCGIQAFWNRALSDTEAATAASAMRDYYGVVM